MVAAAVATRVSAGKLLVFTLLASCAFSHSAPPIPVIGYRHLAPGDVIEAHGAIAHRGGLPVLLLQNLHKIFSRPILAPRRVPAAGQVHLLERPWPVPAAGLIAVLVLLAAAVSIISFRERRMVAQRRLLKRLYSLGEELTAIGSPSESLRRLREMLPKVLNVSGVNLYLYDRSSRLIRRAGEDASPDSALVLGDHASSFTEKAVSACYRNRALLAIPDTHRSPFSSGSARAGQPRSAVFVPMFAQNDLVGILEIHANKVRHFKEDEQALAQHLGNQVAIGMKLVEQQAIREQLFHSEKLAVAGHLISTVAAELREPLETISSLAARLEPSASASESDVRAIAATAQSAAGILEYLLSLAGADSEDTGTADLTALLQGVLKDRANAWRERGLHIHDLLSSDPLPIESPQKLLRKVILSLLSHVERTVSNGSDRNITLRTTRLGTNLQLEISYAAPELDREPADPFGSDDPLNPEALKLGLCRSIVRGFAGDIRLVRGPGQRRCLELELPAPQRTKTEIRKAVQPLTTLLVEPETSARQKLISLLGDGGHRAVPAASAEEAAEFAERLRFHVVFCSVRLPGANWTQLQEKIRNRAGTFVLLAESSDADLQRAVEERNGYVLAKPVEIRDLDRILALVQVSLAAAEPAPPGAPS